MAARRLVSHDRLGDVKRLRRATCRARSPPTLRRHGDLASVWSRAIPLNTEWQRDLSVSHHKLGDVKLAQGDLPGALAAY